MADRRSRRPSEPERNSAVSRIKDTTEKKINTQDTGSNFENEEEDGYFEVEKILGKCVGKKCKIRYYIKWKGYTDEYNSWELEEDLNCEELIEEYEKMVQTKEKAVKEKKIFEEQFMYQQKSTCPYCVLKRKTPSPPSSLISDSGAGSSINAEFNSIKESLRTVPVLLFKEDLFQDL